MKEQIDSTHQYQPLFEGQQKKIQCTHEIVFNITARVMSQDEEGRDTECKEILTKNYHIPVKEKTEYAEFMDAFFKYLEQCLSETAKHAYNNTPTKTGDHE